MAAEEIVVVPVANPAALGLVAFGLTTVLLSLINAGVLPAGGDDVDVSYGLTRTAHRPRHLGPRDVGMRAHDRLQRSCFGHGAQIELARARCAEEADAIEQARHFTAATDVTALAITKLDGTAKGGVVLAVASQFKIPVKFIGVGEKADDLLVFNKHEFVDSLFSLNVSE